VGAEPEGFTYRSASSLYLLTYSVADRSTQRTLSCLGGRRDLGDLYASAHPKARNAREYRKENPAKLDSPIAARSNHAGACSADRAGQLKYEFGFKTQQCMKHHNLQRR